MNIQDQKKCTREIFDVLVKYNASIDQAEDIMGGLVFDIHQTPISKPLDLTEREKLAKCIYDAAHFALKNKKPVLY